MLMFVFFLFFILFMPISLNAYEHTEEHKNTQEKSCARIHRITGSCLDSVQAFSYIIAELKHRGEKWESTNTDLS